MPSSATKLQKSQSAPQGAHEIFSPQKNPAIACLLLVVATLAFYNPIAHCGFVYSDDVPYITKNPAIQAGLTWDTVKWAFSDLHTGFWHPLTWLSHALDCQLFGLNPAGHHYVSLLFHTASAVALLLLLLEATGAGWPSLIVAGLFALHPENVESVAWAAERKNVLSMFFFLLALWAYGQYAKKGGARRYLVVVLLFVVGLMAKTQIVTLPCVLLLWDYWPLRRMFAAPSDVTGAPAPRSFSYLLKEKVPLFILAAVGSAITLRAQREAGAFRSLGEISFSARLGNAVVAYVRYLGHTLWPTGLSPIYPHAGASPPLIQLAGATALLALVTGFVLWRSDSRYLAVGWFWFLGTLFPMIGIVQVGEQAMADRYAYLSMIGFFIVVVWPIAEAVAAKHFSKGLVAVPTVLVLVILGALTYRQLGYWHDGETLWRYALRVTDRNYLAHGNLAMVFDGEGKTDDAISEFRASEALHDYPPEQIVKIGLYEQRYGHLQGAIEQYVKVARSSASPQLRTAAWDQIATAYVQMQNYSQARANYANALQVNPNDEAALVGSALLAERDGDFDRAAGQLDHATKVHPSDVGMLLLAEALHHAGRAQESQAAEDVAQKISSNLDEARRNAAQTQLFFGYKAN